MKQVEIHTDGSCLGNPGPGGWAAVLRFGTAVGGDPLMSPKTAVLAVEKLLKKKGRVGVDKPVDNVNNSL